MSAEVSPLQEFVDIVESASPAQIVSIFEIGPDGRRPRSTRT
jgi:hypothetical protein